VPANVFSIGNRGRRKKHCGNILGRTCGCARGVGFDAVLKQA